MKRKELREHKNKRIRKKLLVYAIAAILIIIISISTYFFSQVYKASQNSFNDLGREKSELREKEVSVSKDPISVLLLGVEDYSSDGANGRTDTIMVLTFNQDDETLKMLSIPRDTLVPIIGRNSEDKINHAYAFGGAEMTIKTVENFLDIPIDYYATIGFKGFKDVIDVVGGITIDVPYDFSEYSDDRTGTLYYQEGEMALDGRLALGYARMRKHDPQGDIGRSERQKQVVQAIIEKLTTASTVFKFNDLTDVYGENVKTNLKFTELFDLYNEYRNFNISNIDQLKLEGQSDLIDDIYYYVIDEQSLSEVSKTLKEHLEL